MRKSKGRRKIEIRKMTKESNLQVTFSKRRSGLFKKASELCTLCAAEIAIIVFSPGNKVFSFGHPYVETIIDRFISCNPQRLSGTMQLIEAHRNATIRDLNMQLTQVMEQLEVEKTRGDGLNEMRKTGQRENWFEGPPKEMNWSQLEQLRASLEELKVNVAKQAQKLVAQNVNPPPQPQPQYYMGSSSDGVGVSFDQNVYDPNLVLPQGYNNNINNNIIAPEENNIGFGQGNNIGFGQGNNIGFGFGFGQGFY